MAILGPLEPTLTQGPHDFGEGFIDIITMYLVILNNM